MRSTADTSDALTALSPPITTIPRSSTVHLFVVGSETEAAPVATSGDNGFFEFDGVAPGQYQVEFVNPTGALATQWYNATAAGAADRGGATTVTLTANQVTGGVNAALGTKPD